MQSAIRRAGQAPVGRAAHPQGCAGGSARIVQTNRPPSPPLGARAGGGPGHILPCTRAPTHRTARSRLDPGECARRMRVREGVAGPQPCRRGSQHEQPRAHLRPRRILRPWRRGARLWGRRKRARASHFPFFFALSVFRCERVVITGPARTATLSAGDCCHRGWSLPPHPRRPRAQERSHPAARLLHAPAVPCVHRRQPAPPSGPGAPVTRALHRAGVRMRVSARGAGLAPHAPCPREHCPGCGAPRTLFLFPCAR
eukprot:scaffold2648_cov120-Isochrysis_galbana.AAC.1